MITKRDFILGGNYFCGKGLLARYVVILTHCNIRMIIRFSQYFILVCIALLKGRHFKVCRILSLKRFKNTLELNLTSNKICIRYNVKV